MKNCFLILTLFWISIAFAQPGDLCPAVNVPFPGSVSGDFTGYNENFSTCAADAATRDRIYRFSLPSAGGFEVKLCGTSDAFDHVLEVREGGACPGTNLVGCSDNYCGYQGRVADFMDVAATFYVIVKERYPGSGGAFQLTLAASSIPPNDHCPGHPITALPFADQGYFGGTDLTTPACLGGDLQDVFYALSVSECELIAINTCSSGDYPAVTVRSGGACPGTTVVACGSNPCPNPLTFNAQAGIPYYIQLSNHAMEGEAIFFAISVDAVSYPDAEDVCPGAAITSLPALFEGNTCCAVADYDACSLTPDQVYALTLPGTALVDVILCGDENWTPQISVRTGGPCPGNVLTDCITGNCSSPNVFYAAAGQTYYLILGGDAGSDCGFFELLLLAYSTSPPDSLVIVPNGDDIQLSWTPSPLAASYRVYRSTNSEVEIIPANLLVSTAANGYTDPDVLIAGEIQHFYRVIAEYPDGP